MEKLTTLPPGGEELLTFARDYWLRVGLATGPGNREVAQSAVCAAYKEAGLAPPTIWIWLDSPLAGVLGSFFLSKVRGQVGDQVGGQVGEQVRDQVRGQVWDQVRDQVGGQVGEQVRDQVRGQVWDQVGEQVRDQVGGQVGEQVRDQVGDHIYQASYGSHDAGWLSFYSTMQAMGVTAASRLSPLMVLAHHTGWWWPFQNACILTPRPDILIRDETGRLHCPDGPAILYPDGWGIWAWHGVRVPQEVIEKPITLQQINNETNTEVRRVMLERYGWGKYLTDAGCEEVARDECGVLLRRQIPGENEPIMMVRVKNSTPEPDGTYKETFLSVPPTMTTPRQAVAWTFYLEPEQYKLQKET